VLVNGSNLLRGSVYRHLFTLSVPILADLAIVNLYYVVDLYFIARLGDAPTAGVSAAGSVLFLFMACSQVMNVGTSSLVANVAGRGDIEAIRRILQQSLLLGGGLGVVVLLLGYWLSPSYLRSLTADDASAQFGITYLCWSFPGLWIGFAVSTMRAGLRGLGAVKVATSVQLITVGLNIVLAPVLINGVGTSYPLGVTGAALARTFAVVVSAIILWRYLDRHIGLGSADWRPKPRQLQRVLWLGLPASGEMLLMFAYTSVCFWAIRDLGADTQAAFAVTSRVLQVLYLPVMAIAFALVPLAGQNLGGGNTDRAARAFKIALASNLCFSLLATLACELYPEVFVRGLSPTGSAGTQASHMLDVLGWSLVPIAIVLSCSSAMQALGNTLFSLLSSCIRLAFFASPLLFMALASGRSLEMMLHLAVWTVVLQANVSLVWLGKLYRTYMARRGWMPSTQREASLNE
jgi:putative MATE family efflux protein